MKKTLAATALIIIFLAVFIPLASSNPDGLEKVAATFGADEKQPVWSGLMADYSLPAIGNSYASTLIAGITGTIIVLAAGLLLGRIITKNQNKTAANTASKV
jgi:ABC-type Fe3+ transport system permease subunit